jgi:hypothetical protein
MLDIATWTTMALMQFPLRHVKTSDASAIVGLVATGAKRMWDHPMSWSGARSVAARKSVERNSSLHEHPK